MCFMRKLLLFLILLAGCHPQSSTSPVNPDASDAAPVPGPDVCGLAETNLLKLQCADTRGRLLGGPDLHGTKWSDVCRIDADAGISLVPSCIAAASTCAEVMLCK